MRPLGSSFEYLDDEKSVGGIPTLIYRLFDLNKMWDEAELALSMRACVPAERKILRQAHTGKRLCTDMP